MKKSVLFLINGLGIEKKESYSIAIDQCMPNLSKTKETSYFTTAIIDSVEYRSAYESFFLGDTYRSEVDYINENILNDNVINNQTFINIKNSLANETSKLHVFLEPTNDKIVDSVNKLVTMLGLGTDRKVFLHLLLTQQTVNEYKKLITIVNYIKYHIDEHITVGFIIGKENITDEVTKEQNDYLKKMFFACSCERWSETDKKLISLQESNIRPCVAPGFCATNDCKIENGDTILFFNTRRTNYDKFINVIKNNAVDMLKTDQVSIPFYSIIRLDTKHNIIPLAENIKYNNTLADMLQKAGKKCLIITEERNLNLVNLLANGLNPINNPNIQFMKLDYNYLMNINNIVNIIDGSQFDLIIFDFHMDVSRTINDLKNQLAVIDVCLGHVATTCVNKHSLFITSLYGIKKDIPLADYNSEIVTIDYELQIPIFFFDYTYPRSKYMLAPGETNDILKSALKCIWNTSEIDSLVRVKGLLSGLFRK